MSAPTERDAFLDALATLHTRTVDALKGLDTAHEKADESLKPALGALIDVHKRHEPRLATMLSENGRTPDKDGSFMSVVHETIVSARAAFDALDEDALPRILSGENAMLDLYCEAIGSAGAVDDEKETLSSLRRELKAEVDKLSGEASLAA